MTHTSAHTGTLSILIILAVSHRIVNPFVTFAFYIFSFEVTIFLHMCKVSFSAAFTFFFSQLYSITFSFLLFLMPFPPLKIIISTTQKMLPCLSYVYWARKEPINSWSKWPLANSYSHIYLKVLFNQILYTKFGPEKARALKTP